MLLTSGCLSIFDGSLHGAYSSEKPHIEVVEVSPLCELLFPAGTLTDRQRVRIISMKASMACGVKGRTEKLPVLIKEHTGYDL